MINYAPARAADIADVERVLVDCGLPTDGIPPFIENFIIARQDPKVIGVVGLEVHGGFGLLRSLAVLPHFRGKGIGKELYYRAIAHAQSKNIIDLYLLTTTAEGYFSKRGFIKTERTNVPAPLQTSIQFKSLCPKSAVCMKLGLKDQPIYFPQETLSLKPAVPGAKMWGVALEKTLLTYFELEPNCRFDRHKHESEQITMVLEGELFFELEKDTFCLKPGEVIAIPSNISHAVFTREKHVKAIDAWSPVMPQYIRPSNALQATLSTHKPGGQRA